jgi:hypothetical protein
VDSVIGFDLVCGDQEARKTQFTEASAQTHLVPYFIRDVTVAEEGSLHDVDEVVQGPLQPVGDDHHDQFDVAVEQGDGSVACELSVVLSRL